MPAMPLRHRPVFTRAAVLRALLLAAACAPLAARAAAVDDGMLTKAAPKKARAPWRAASDADAPDAARAPRPPAKKVAPRGTDPV